MLRDIQPLTLFDRACVYILETNIQEIIKAPRQKEKVTKQLGIFLCRGKQKLGCLLPYLPSQFNCFGLKRFLPEQSFCSASLACSSDSCLYGPRGKDSPNTHHHLIGRGLKTESNTLMLPGDAVSKHHCTSTIRCNSFQNLQEKLS